MQSYLFCKSLDASFSLGEDVLQINDNFSMLPSVATNVYG